MRYWLLSAAVVTALVGAPAESAVYAVSVDLGQSLVLPKIDPANERLEDLFFWLQGTVHYDARAYGWGVDVAPFEIGTRRTYAVSFSHNGSVGDALAYVNAGYPANTKGAVGTYIDYSYDADLMAFNFGGSAFYLDRLSDLYSAPQTLSTALNVYDEYYAGSAGPVTFSDARLRVSAYLITAPVPEPASWITIIGGFVVAGTAMRRRRSSSTALAPILDGGSATT